PASLTRVTLRSSSIAWTPLVRPTPRSAPCAFSSWLSRADHLTNRPRRYSNQVSTGPRVVSSELIVQLSPLTRKGTDNEGARGDGLPSPLGLELPVHVLEVVCCLVLHQHEGLHVPLASLSLEDGLNSICNLRAVPDRKSTRLNSSHVSISYAVFCL